MIAAGDRLRDLRRTKEKRRQNFSLLGTTQQIYSRYENKPDRICLFDI